MAVVAFILSLPLFVAASINAFAYAERRRSEPPARARPDRMPGPVTARWFAVECLATAFAIASWPFGLTLPRRIPRHPSMRFALLLPELGCPVGSLSLLARRLRRAGWQPVVGTALPPGIQIDKAAGRLRSTLQRVRERHPSAEIAIIAHGASGILARQMLRQIPSSQNVVLATLGTAHQGTQSRVARTFARLVRGAIRLLKTAGEPDRNESVESFALASDFDAWVLPAAASYEAGSFNVEIRGVGHYSFLTSRRIAEILLENLGPTTSPSPVVADRS